MEDSDRATLSLPVAIIRKMGLVGTKFAVDREHGRYDALEQAGFKVERYCDIWKSLVEQLGGHYQDVGCSAKIAAGLVRTCRVKVLTLTENDIRQITVKSDASPIQYTSTGLEFSDGSELEADVVVWCTGFEIDTRKHALRWFGPDVANGLDDCWGLDEEGELRGVFKPTCGIPFFPLPRSYSYDLLTSC